MPNFVTRPLRRLITVLGLACFALVFTGCASPYMNELSENEAQQNIDPALKPDEAGVIIIRPSIVGAAVSAVISEGLNQHNFVGIAMGRTKILYKTKAGTKYFFVSSEGDSNVIKAELAPQKYYYLMTYPTWGWMRCRFYFDDPANYNTEDIKKALQDSKWSLVNESGKTWFNNHYESIEEKNAGGLIDWQDDGGTPVIRADQGYDQML